MEINEIMKRLSVFGQDEPVPREALAEAARQREAITPLLLELLDWLLENVQARGEDVYKDSEYDRSLYAIFLLAQFREKRAYPRFIRILSLDDERLDIAVGDEVTRMGDLLYSTYDGDLAAAMALAADGSLDPFARSAAVELMRGLVADGRMAREELVRFIRERLDAVGDSDGDALFAALLADNAANADLFELAEDFWRAYRQEKVDITLLGDFDGFLDELLREPDPQHRTRYLDDAAEALSDMVYFQRDGSSKPDVFEIMRWNVGRNDPCPCGSGKKFKKCCLPRLQEWELSSRDYARGTSDPYPPVTGRDGRPGLADLYSRDAIAVDEPAFQAMNLLHGAAHRARAEEHQARRQARELLWRAFMETRRICAENGLRTPEEFDEGFHVHYQCERWLEDLIDLLDNEDPRLQEAEAFLYSDTEDIED